MQPAPVDAVQEKKVQKYMAVIANRSLPIRKPKPSEGRRKGRGESREKDTESRREEIALSGHRTAIRIAGPISLLASCQSRKSLFRVVIPLIRTVFRGGFL